MDPPIDFGELRARANLVSLEVTVPIACIEDLITMKKLAGRPKDLEDIAALESIARRRMP